MKINNNFNNNRQINFKADVRLASGEFSSIASKLVQIGKNAKGTEGGLAVVTHLFEPSYKAGHPDVFTTMFHYYEKDEVISSRGRNVSFISANDHTCKLVDGLEISTKSFTFEERMNKIVEQFQEFMDVVSKK